MNVTDLPISHDHRAAFVTGHGFDPARVSIDGVTDEGVRCIQNDREPVNTWARREEPPTRGGLRVFVYQYPSPHVRDEGIEARNRDFDDYEEQKAQRRRRAREDRVTVTLMQHLSTTHTPSAREIAEAVIRDLDTH